MEKSEGHRHPISCVIAEVNSIFWQMGFSVAQGPEIETEFNNFDALNIPADHPARDMWDTIWLSPKESGKLLRTHTSPVQIHYMREHPPTDGPIRIIVPGKVFRYEATDATHETQFYQIEGLLVDSDITLAHLKGILQSFFEQFLGKGTEIRFRPSYFPFVEPGVEIDIRRKDFRGGDWLEVMGAGMIHPKVLENVDIDPGKYQGFAFGGGIDRLVMLKYNIPDIRLFYSGDLRFVNQF